MDMYSKANEVSFIRSCFCHPAAMLLDFRMFITLITIYFVFNVFSINSQPLRHKYYNQQRHLINPQNMGDIIVYLLALMVTKYMIIVFGNLLYKRYFNDAFLINFTSKIYLIFFIVDLLLSIFLIFQRCEKKYSKSTLLILLCYFALIAITNFFKIDVYYLEFGFPEIIAGFVISAVMTSFYSKTIASFFKN